MSQLNIQERLPGIGIAPPVAWAIQLSPGLLEMTVWQADGDPSTYQLIRWNSDLGIWLPVDGAFVTLDSRSVLNGAKQLTWPVNATGYYAIWRSNGNGRSAGAISGASGAGPGVTLAGDVTGESGANSVVKLQGRAVSPTAPTDGQIIRWDAATSSWKPYTLSVQADKITSLTAETQAAQQITIGPGAHHDFPAFTTTAMVSVTYAYGAAIYGFYDDGANRLITALGGLPDFTMTIEATRIPRLTNTSGSGYTLMARYDRSI